MNKRLHNPSLPIKIQTTCTVPLATNSSSETYKGKRHRTVTRFLNCLLSKDLQFPCKTFTLHFSLFLDKILGYSAFCVCFFSSSNRTPRTYTQPRWKPLEPFLQNSLSLSDMGQAPFCLFYPKSDQPLIPVSSSTGRPISFFLVFITILVQAGVCGDKIGLLKSTLQITS